MHDSIMLSGIIHNCLAWAAGCLNGTFEALAENPELERIYEVYEGLRVYPSGRHLIFFLATNEGIDVVRVLHERMDIPSHL